MSGFFHKYALNGFLLDGTDGTGASLLVQNGTGASFALINQVPEPGTVALVGLGSTLLATRRRPSSRPGAGSGEARRAQAA